MFDKIPVSMGIPYKLRNKDAIGGRGWNIATQERKICDVEIEIVTFVINGSVKLTVPPDRQKKFQVRSRSVALCRVFDLEFNGIHLAQVILKIWVVYGQNIIDVPVCEIEPRRQLFPPSIVLYKTYKNDGQTKQNNKFLYLKNLTNTS